MSLQKLYLELTDRCNLNCSICYRRSWEDSPQDLAGSLYAKIVSEVRQLPDLKTVVLGGIGEPTMAPAFVQALTDFKDKRLVLTTNGIGISDELLQEMIGKLDTIVVSVDGMEDTFYTIRGVPLAEVTDMIRRLQRTKAEWKSGLPLVHLQCVLSTENVGEVFELIDLASSLGVQTIHFSNLMPQTEENRDKIVYKPYDNGDMKQLFSKMIAYSFRKGVQLVLPQIELKTERYCRFIEDKSMFISAQGLVLPCYRLSHNYIEYVFGRKKHVDRYVFGSVQEQTIDEIWNNPQYKRFRNTVYNGRYPSCPDCDWVDGCDYVSDTSSDCWGCEPSCSDCLWSRGIVLCP